MSTESTEVNSLRYFRHPFVMITSCISVGILIGYSLETFYTIFVAILGGFLLILNRVQKSNRLGNLFFYAFIISLFTSIGMFAIQHVRPSSNELNTSIANLEHASLLLRLDEVSESGSEWKKVVGTTIENTRTHRKFSIPLVLYIKSNGFGLREGDIILTNVRINLIRNFGNPGEFDAEYYWHRKGIFFTGFVNKTEFKFIDHIDKSWVADKLESCRLYLKNLLTQNLEGKELSIALALILGDKSLLDMETRNSFTNTGAMHVLAVSGLHIGIIMHILLAFFKLFSRWISRKHALISVLVLMWIYAVITGLSPSVLRAVFMFSVLVIAKNSGLSFSSINVLFFTGFVLILLDPYILYDIGFQLSFLAMLGIYLFYKPIDRLIFTNNKILKKVWQGTAIGFAAQIMTTPLSLYYFHQFPNYFVLTNIGLMLSSELILGFGLLLFATGWSVWMAKYSGILIAWSVILSLWVIEGVEKIPGAVAYGFEVSIWYVLILGILAFLLFLIAKSRLHRILIITGVFALLTIIVLRRYENLNSDKLCIFNSKNLALIVKKSDKLICVHAATDSNKLKKVMTMVESFVKIYPSEIQYITLIDKNLKIENDELSLQIEKRNFGYKMNFNGKKMNVLMSNQEVKERGLMIGMPWIEMEMDHNLSEGAYMLNF